MIEKTTEMNRLFDFYHVLLTEKQQEYMEMYYQEDYSLGEIAERSGVSRQAIYDTIKRTEQILVTYEEKLLLYDKFIRRHTILKELERVLHQEEKATILPLLEALQNID
jgi:predicted DNA-binding protein YlxM (UPF0122 family)